MDVSFLTKAARVSALRMFVVELHAPKVENWHQSISGLLSSSRLMEEILNTNKFFSKKLIIMQKTIIFFMKVSVFTVLFVSLLPIFCLLNELNNYFLFIIKKLQKPQLLNFYQIVKYHNWEFLKQCYNFYYLCIRWTVISKIL